MDSGSKDSAARMIVCLIADESIAQRLPSSLRYLQIGLIDEMIDLLLIVPEDEGHAYPSTGSTQVLTYRPRAWPLAGMARKRVTSAIVEKMQSLKPTTPILVHGLTSGVRYMASEIAAAIDGQLLLSIWSASDLEGPHRASIVGKTAALLAPSEVVAQAVRPRLPSDRTIDVVPVGVTIGASPAVFRDAHRAPTLVFAGILREGAGIETLLRAARRVMQQHPNLLIFIIGSGPGEAGLRRLVQKLEIDQQVVFTGRIEYLRTALEAADIFCLPSTAAPHGEELIHAMAAGLAIVAAHRCPYDGLDDEQTALMFPDGDEDSLTSNLLQLLDDPESARRMGAAVMDVARSQHSVTRMVEGHARIYRQLDRRERTFTLEQKAMG